MAFSQTDLDNIEEALISIATTGVAELEINGQRTKYIDIDKLFKMRDKIRAEINNSNRGSAILKPRITDPS